MRHAIWFLLALLAACRTPQPVTADATPSVVLGAPLTEQKPVARTQQSVALLPAYRRSGTVREELSLLERPKASSGIIKILAAGSSVQLLGEISNAEGRWLSVAINDTQGWVRSAEITPDP